MVEKRPVDRIDLPFAEKRYSVILPPDAIRFWHDTVDRCVAMVRQTSLLLDDYARLAELRDSAGPKLLDTLAGRVEAREMLLTLPLSSSEVVFMELAYENVHYIAKGKHHKKQYLRDLTQRFKAASGRGGRRAARR